MDSSSRPNREVFRRVGGRRAAPYNPTVKHRCWPAGLLPPQDPFEKALLEGRTLNDRKLMVKAVKTYPEEALVWFRGKCDLFNLRNDAEAGKLADELIEVWKEAYNSDLLKNIQRHRAGLDTNDVMKIEKLVREGDRAWGIFEGAKISKKDQEFRLAAQGAQKVAEALEEIGEKLVASRAWLQLVNILEGTPNRTPEETALQVKAIGIYLQLHKDWDWTRSLAYAQNSEWERGLRERLKNPPAGEKGKDGEKGASPGAADAAGAKPDSLLAYAPGSKWVDKKLDYSVAKKALDGISLFASSSPLYWIVGSLEDVKAKEIELFKDGKLILRRGGANKYLNVSGGKEREIKLGGTSKPTELWYERADDKGNKEELNYAMWLWTGGNQEPWCGTTLNFQPQWKPATPEQNFANFYWRSAAVFTADIEGVPITLHDESGNGVFGEKPGSVGITPDHRLADGLDQQGSHPTLDSMQIGNGPLLPFSSFVHIKESWYTVKAVRNNEELRYRLIDPAKAQTGHIVVKWSGPPAAKPKHLVVVESSGTWADAAFDLFSGAGPKGVEVLAGTYEVLYGRVWNGRPPQNMDAVILKGEAKPIEVKAGQTVTLEIGAPFGIEFTPERAGKSLGADTTKMWVKDRFGLKWTCLVAEILEPQLLVAKDAKGGSTKVLCEWKRIEGTELDEVHKNYEKQRIPATTLAMFAVDKKTWRFDQKATNPLPDPSFVGVGQKKHKLFGELKPIWR
jgi:hypothetical protein